MTVCGYDTVKGECDFPKGRYQVAPPQLSCTVHLPAIRVRPWREEDMDGLVGLAERNGAKASREELSVEFERQGLSELGKGPRASFRLVAERRGEIVSTGIIRPSIFVPPGMPGGERADGRSLSWARSRFDHPAHPRGRGWAPWRLGP